MRPLGLVVGTLLLAAAGGMHGAAASRFDVKLSNDRHAIHALNRLTYGPRPGDLGEIRRIGVETWIRRQLNPRQIPEDPALDARLKLGSLQLATWEIFETYQPKQPTMQFATPNMGQLLRPDHMRTIFSGPASERRAILESLTADVRRKVLSQVAPQSLEGQPDLKREAEKARLVEQEIRNRLAREEQRLFHPPLHDLLTPEQSVDLQHGTDAEKTAVLASLGTETRTLVFRSFPTERVPDAFRREALIVTNPQQAVTAELIDAKLARALYSTRQLEEVLVDFWLNHFNVFNGKGAVRMFLTSYERDAIRPHVLGRFRDMLQATARHPAMLFYLDNYQSKGPQERFVSGGQPVQPGLNENYGRELMELHTLGVNGGYTQADVINVARVFTGWTIFEPQRIGEFQFNPAMHDRGEKVVLGHVFPRGGGEEEGLKVIDILASHPSTARFISRKLAQRFVADDPPQALVDRMAADFRKSDGDLRIVMETLLLSREFLSEGAWRAKLKSPLEMVVSSLRALDAHVTDTTALAQRIADLGQPLYGKAEPTGYPNTTEAWASSAGLLGRMNFATALVEGKIAGVKVSPDRVASGGVRQAMTDLLGVEASAESVAAIESGPDGTPPAPELLTSVLIASPDFQKR